MSKHQRKINNKYIISEINSRRNTRLGPIIGMVAIMVSICSMLFRCTKSVISIWPKSGYVYYISVWSIFMIPLAATLIIVFDIIAYLLVDLKRYDIENEQYHKYDKESDQKYYYLIKDIKIMLQVFWIDMVAICIINSFFQNSTENIFALISSSVILILWIAFSIKRIISKEIKWKEVWNVIKRISVLGIIALMEFIIAVSFVTNKEGHVDIIFDKNGDITIENALDDDFGTVSLSIFTEDDFLVNKTDILVEDVLRAKESKGQSAQNTNGKIIGEAQDIPGDMSYWKYQLEMKELELPVGKYYVVIEIKQDNKSVEIINMFIVNKSEFIFCKNSFSKTY